MTVWLDCLNIYIFRRFAADSQRFSKFSLRSFVDHIIWTGAVFLNDEKFYSVILSIDKCLLNAIVTNKQFVTWVTILKMISWIFTACTAPIVYSAMYVIHLLENHGCTKHLNEKRTIEATDRCILCKTYLATDDILVLSGHSMRICLALLLLSRWCIL